MCALSLDVIGPELDPNSVTPHEGVVFLALFRHEYASNVNICSNELVSTLPNDLAHPICFSHGVKSVRVLELVRLNGPDFPLAQDFGAAC